MKALFSLALSVLTVLTIWLVLPLLVMPPVAAWLGWRSYKEAMHQTPPPAGLRRVRALIPLAVAGLVFVGGFWLMNTQYRP